MAMTSVDNKRAKICLNRFKVLHRCLLSPGRGSNVTSYLSEPCIHSFGHTSKYLYEVVWRKRLSATITILRPFGLNLPPSIRSLHLYIPFNGINERRSNYLAESLLLNPMPSIECLIITVVPGRLHGDIFLSLGSIPRSIKRLVLDLLPVTTKSRHHRYMVQTSSNWKPRKPRRNNIDGGPTLVPRKAASLFVGKSLIRWMADRNDEMELMIHANLFEGFNDAEKCALMDLAGMRTTFKR